MRKENIRIEWRRMKDSAQFHNVLMFLVFVAIATIFWFVVALNDNITETFRVRLNIQGVPDSVTFITLPPADIHVTVRDKGTNILRSGVIKNPTVDINFRDYAHDGVLRLSHTDLTSELKADLGGAATITSASLDSLRLYYTASPGKRVPVVVQSDVRAASGYVIASEPISLTKSVKVYSMHDETDTIKLVRTRRLVKNNLSQTEVYKVRVVQIPGVRVIPDEVDVRVNVEPLVHREEYVDIDILNVPEGRGLLLFPNRVPVSFYVPMSRFNDTKVPIEVTVDYEETRKTDSSKLPLHLRRHGPGLINVELKADSVEYTVVS